MASNIFLSIIYGLSSFPTDELHHFSEGWNHQPVINHFVDGITQKLGLPPTPRRGENPGDNRRGGLFDQSLHALHVLVNRQKCLLCILLHQARITSGNTGKVKKHVGQSLFGGFLKWGVPEIIQTWTILVLKPMVLMVLGFPQFQKTQICNGKMQ